MSAVRQLVFWQDCPSPHQSSVIRALADSGSYEVKLVVALPTCPGRDALGWSRPDFGDAEVIVAPEQSKLTELAIGEASCTAHFFSSVHYVPMIRQAFSASRQTPALIGLLSEGRDWRGIKGLARRLHALVTDRRYVRRADFVLAIGSLGMNWYSRCGVDSKKIFPFGYFIESSHTAGDAPAVPRGPFRLIFVARLDQNKRGTLLLQALGALRDLAWHCTIIGDGPELSRMHETADKLRIADRLTFHGVLPNAEVLRLISQSDLLVLPSKKDGWGAVINEALMMGVPVVCSNFCGGSVLLNDERGDVFAVDSVSSLSNTLRQRVEKGPITESTRRAIREWAQCLDGRVVASYISEVLVYADAVRRGRAATRPRPPWLVKPIRASLIGARAETCADS